MKHVFIINQTIAKKQLKHLVQEINRQYASMDYVIEYTQYRGHAREIAYHYARSTPKLRIYSCGGDGTLHEIINGAYGFSDIEIAIIPMGTGNDFIKNFPFEPEIFRDLKNYQQPTFSSVDLIKCNDEVCINTLSLGFDVNIARKVERFKKLPFFKGTLPYYASLLSNMFEPLESEYHLLLGDQLEIHHKEVFVVVCNGQYYGGGYHPCPNAHINDGILDYCLIHDVSKAMIVRLAKLYKHGTHTNYPQYVDIGQLKKMKILNPQPVYLNLDGEVKEMRQPSIQIVSSHLILCLPHSQ